MKEQKTFLGKKKRITKLKIKTIVDKVSEGLNIPCGCGKRKDALNQMFPYNNAVQTK